MVASTRSSTPRGRRSGSSPTPQQSSKSSTPKNSSASIKNFSQFPTFPRTPSAVFFYVPNLIGYLRIMCTVVSLLIMDSNLSNPKPNNWKIAVILYLCSFVGDMFDGMAARHFDQSSTFGAVLDMLTDRITTAAMLVVLTWIYPSERLFYFCVLALDITSHWLQMYSSLLCKLHHKSKESNEGRFFLVRWFYGNFWFFGYLCVGAEMFYVARFCEFYSGSLFFEGLKKFCLPAMTLKNIVNVAQMGSAAHMIAEKDVKEYNGKRS